VKVLDFGIAKLSTPSGHTETGVLKGKVRYMSPEQALGEPLDRATDVFAMGIVLWEALAERSLWQQKNEMQILQVLLNGDPLPAVGGVNPAVPERLSLACMKALAYRSEDRFASCAEFRSELLDCLEELPGEITNEEIGRSVAGMFAAFREQQRSNISKQLALLDAAEQAADPSGPVSEERPRRRTGRVWFLSALGFAIAFGGAYALSQGGANLVREQGAVPSALPAAVAAPLPTASELSPAARTAISEQPMGSSSAASAALPPGSNLPRRLRKRNKAGESTAESSAPPAATGAAPVSAPADGSRMQLDTGNPWSSGAAPAKP
jgi:serine/threonine-protein kinase